MYYNSIVGWLVIPLAFFRHPLPLHFLCILRVKVSDIRLFLLVFFLLETVLWSSHCCLLLSLFWTVWQAPSYSCVSTFLFPSKSFRLRAHTKLLLEWIKNNTLYNWNYCGLFLANNVVLWKCSILLPRRGCKKREKKWRKEKSRKRNETVRLNPAYCKILLWHFITEFLNIMICHFLHRNSSDNFNLIALLGM